jgi:SAM-dependent methyltransferase
VDLVVAFAVVHELPDQPRFFAELRRCLAAGGKVLLAEPAGHVSIPDFEATLAAAGLAGFARAPGPSVRRSLTALLA